ncbi:hypothetical protein [Methylobacterium nigriterrae]|uniref:hypothetical protein n=1 Tax=Methylobacterium nigriterrae TaxID=3127512 RepID=UPI003013EA60
MAQTQPNFTYADALKYAIPANRYGTDGSRLADFKQDFINRYAPYAMLLPMTRAVLIGLLGATLSVSGAVATPKSCPADKAVLTVKDTHFRYAMANAIQRPDLIGRTFRIARFTRGNDTGSNGVPEAYEIVGSAGHFIVKRQHWPAVPFVSASSAAAGEPKQFNVAWAPPTRGAETFEDYVFDGPLSSLTISLKSCSR